MSRTYPLAFRVFASLVLAGSASGQGTPAQTESPYEIVMRLRREAAAKKAPENAVVAPAAADVEPKPGAPADRLPETLAGPRILHFPADRSLGRLSVQDANAVRRIVDFHHWIDGTEWEYLGQAKGDVVVPDGQRLMLTIDTARAWRDLSPLARLPSDAFYELSLSGSESGGPKPGDSCMEYISTLTGLRCLALGNTNISSRGMSLVPKLGSLERLLLSTVIDDGGLAYIAELPGLRGLYIKNNRVTDAGLSNLARLGLLEELDIRAARMTDAGIAHLAALPHLEYLMLSGGLSDAGMAHLRKFPSLRIISLNNKQFSNTGLKYLSECPRLERIDIHWMEQVTDDGLACLKNMRTLRKLDILHSQVTDAGLVHLGQVETLDYLMLPARITETGLHHLKGLKGLKFLWVSGSTSSAVGDQGLAELAGLPSLEELLICGNGITDAGVDELVKLGHLKKLTLTASPRMTDAGLKRLTVLRGLESLSLSRASISISGLSLLNGLPRLTRLHVRGVEQDGSGLDLSGLTHLEDLSLQLKRGRGADRAVSQPWREQDIAALGKLTGLKRLQLSHAGATDAALRCLTGLKRLERLSIGGDGLTDQGLACLAELPRLRDLNLTGRFTDRALEHLQKLPNLETLDFLSGANFSPAALNEFRRNMPRLVRYENRGQPRTQRR